MIGPGEVMIALIVIGLPVISIFYGFHRFFKFREKQLDADTRLAAEKAAQYAASNAELEARVRVLEKIVTDGGIETAAQIEALRSTPSLPKSASRQSKGDKVQ
jgi:hypothetical protein